MPPNALRFCCGAWGGGGAGPPPQINCIGRPAAPPPRPQSGGGRPAAPRPPHNSIPGAAPRATAPSAASAGYAALPTQQLLRVGGSCTCMVVDDKPLGTRLLEHERHRPAHLGRALLGVQSHYERTDGQRTAGAEWDDVNGAHRDLEGALSAEHLIGVVFESIPAAGDDAVVDRQEIRALFVVLDVCGRVRTICCIGVRLHERLDLGPEGWRCDLSACALGQAGTEENGYCH